MAHTANRFKKIAKITWVGEMARIQNSELKPGMVTLKWDEKEGKWFLDEHLSEVFELPGRYDRPAFTTKDGRRIVYDRAAYSTIAVGQDYRIQASVANVETRRNTARAIRAIMPAA